MFLQSNLTRGCFGLGCIPALTDNFAVPGGGASIQFQTSSFNGTTTAATSALSVSNFGTFEVINPGAGGVTPFSTPFTLQVSFLSPTTSSAPVSTLTISGVLGNSAAQRDVSFTASASNTVSFTGGFPSLAAFLAGFPGAGPLSGNLRFTTRGGFIGAGPATITGRVIVSNVVTSVPEPATVALFATGLVALGAAARRRRTV